MKQAQLLALEIEQHHEVCDYHQFLSLVNKRRNEVTQPREKVEKVLLSRLLSGDRAAFSIIFSAYYKDLVAFAMSYTHNQQVSEEIAQDIFVRLWEEHETAKIEQSLKSYLLTSVRNKCINLYKHKQVMQMHADDVRDRSPFFACDTDNYLLFSELQDQLNTALDKLPDEISGPFRMNRNQGLKYHEIADILGVSVRTIEVRIGKALHLLRIYLKDYFRIVILILCLWQ